MSQPNEYQPVPLLGQEKESLHIALKRHRQVVRWKLAGLDDEQLRRPMTPSGLNLLGLVKHLAAVEFGWFCAAFGHDTEPLPFDEDEPNADLRVGDDETTADIMAFFERACAAADVAINDHDLDDHGTAWTGDTISMRWALIHMVEEVARHVGHIDIMRELIDGLVGDHDRT